MAIPNTPLFVKTHDLLLWLIRHTQRGTILGMGLLLATLVAGLAGDARAAGSQSFFYRRTASGNTYAVGNRYGNGGYSSSIARVGPGGATGIYSGSHRGHASGGYYHYGPRGGNSFHWSR